MAKKKEKESFVQVAKRNAREGVIKPLFTQKELSGSISKRDIRALQNYLENKAELEKQRPTKNRITFP